MTIHIPDYNADMTLSFFNPPILFLADLGIGNFFVRFIYNIF